ncbi:MAG: SUF system NifU family Fe-S cluster assembly protein [Proteobacteria bacterium]|nr:SUF system NifU family Fe-S cluster assembly protein [Pseudomonadota bacterium]
MFDDLRELYQEVILDHSKRPRNFGRLEADNRRAKGHNPLCGDILSLYLTVEDGVVEDVAFEGNGCAISMASASLMTEIIKGRGEAEARALFERFHRLLTSDDADLDHLDLDKLAVFAGVREFPVRVKCATLAWHTLAAALDRRADDVSTED